MLFRLENFGPLREAEVDLSKDLIVLTGPNNTGKTYLAWSVYGLHRAPTGPADFTLRWADDLLGSNNYQIDLAEHFAREKEHVLDALATGYLGQISRCFAAEPERFNGAKLTLSMQDSPALASWSSGSFITGHPDLQQNVIVYRADPEHGRYGLALVDLDTKLEWLNLSEQLRQNPTSNEVFRVMKTATRSVFDRVREFVASTINRILWNALLPTSVILPAERIAINIFAKELAFGRTKLVDELVDASLQGQQEYSLDDLRERVGTYPWPIRDSILNANDLHRTVKRKSRMVDLADEIERSVLEGAIGVSEHGEVFFSPERAEGQRLQVHLTASVVKSLSSLVLYFRHRARPRDFLIIDEPELNLHPDNQRKIARILAKAVRRGLKIMISTHSDYLIRELNHLIMLSKLPAEEVQEFGYDPECTLSPEQVGVYLFKDHTAKPIPVGETGFSVQTIDDEINALNADAQRLYARLFG